MWRPERPVREERPVALTTRAVHLRVRSGNHAAVAGTAHLHAGWISIQRHNMLIYRHMARRTSGAVPALLAGGLCKMLHLNFGEFAFHALR